MVYSGERERLLRLPLFRGNKVLKYQKRTMEWIRERGGEAVLSSFPLDTSQQDALRALGIDSLRQLLLTVSDRLGAHPAIGPNGLEEIRAHAALAMLGPGHVRQPVVLEKPFTVAGLEALPLFSRIELPDTHPSGLHSSYLPDARLDEVELSQRARAVVRRLGANHLGDLLLTSRKAILTLPNAGQMTLRELREAARRHLLVANGILPKPEASYSSFGGMMRSFVYLAVPNAQWADIVLNRMRWDKSKRLTLSQLGKRHGLTRERIRQIADMCLQTLSHPSKRGLLATFWEAAGDAVSDDSLDRTAAIGHALARRFGWRSAPTQPMLASVMALNPNLVVPRRRTPVGLLGQVTTERRVSRLSIGELECEIASRQRGLRRLQQERQQLAKRLERLDARIRRLVGERGEGSP